MCKAGMIHFKLLFDTITYMAKAYDPEKLDAWISNAIKSNKGGILTPTALARAIGVDEKVVTKRVRANGAIRRHMERQTREWLDTLDDKEFLEYYSKPAEFPGLPRYAKEIMWERLDGIILRAIESIEGTPTEKALGRAIGISPMTVASRIDANKVLEKGAEGKWEKWAGGMGQKEFLKEYSRGITNRAREYAKRVIWKRLDRIILEKIEKSREGPNARALERALGIGQKAITTRIGANAELWIAYQRAKGLTSDQAVELSLERNDESKAFTDALARRLRHLSAYREMVGLIRCFGDLMENAVSCVSMYPGALAKAARELGTGLRSNHVPMKEFWKAQAVDIPACDTVVVHRLHRLPEKGLNLLFGKIRELYGENPKLSIITTHSMHYSASEEFLSAMAGRGFGLEESGVVKIGSPGSKILESYGVPPDGLKRMGRKVSWEFSVLVFRIGGGKGEGTIPGLTMSPSLGNGTPGISSRAEEVDIPEGMCRELSARLFPSVAVAASSPFIVEIISGGRKRALVGFDMKPGKKNMIEIEFYPNAPAANYRKIAHMLATEPLYRERLGVKPGKVHRVHKVRLLQCIRVMDKMQLKTRYAQKRGR